MILKLMIITCLVLAGAQAGQMITPNNPVAIMYDEIVYHEDGNMTVYLTACMMPEPEPGITFISKC